MRIFVSPLDWGLGHAARCISVIRYLLEKKNEVIIGAEGKHLVFLKEHFPNAEFVEFPGYRISYSITLPVGAMVFFQIPKMVSAIKKEHKLLDKLITEKKIDAVISDNRYGLWSKQVPCVILTHQLNIQAKGFNKIVNSITHSYIRHFDECWISDYAGDENLTGMLSHPIPKGINGKYVGPLSRFMSQPQTPKGALTSATQSPFRACPELASGGLGSEKYDLLVTLSGPEPQRTILEEMVLNQLKDLPTIKAFIMQGLPGGKLKESRLNNVEIAPHLADKEFFEKLSESEILLSRSGYSTIMDLDTLGWKKTIFIPTPGQTEHEYLGKLMEKKGLAVTYNQKGFSLKEAMEKAKQLKPAQPIHQKENFTKVMDEWLKKINP